MPVDKVNPDALPKIIAELEKRDNERNRLGKQSIRDCERELAEMEALSWYNGSKRIEYENGKV